MTLREKLTSVSESNISKLVYNNQVIGLRVKLFNLNNNTFEYFDFTLNTALSSIDQVLGDYLKSIQSTLSCIELKEHNGILTTADEYYGKIVVKELQINNPQSKVVIKKLIEDIKKINEYNRGLG